MDDNLNRSRGRVEGTKPLGLAAQGAGARKWLPDAHRSG